MSSWDGAAIWCHRGPQAAFLLLSYQGCTPSQSRGDDFVKAVLHWAVPAETHAYLIVYSSTDRRSFEISVDLLFELRETGETISKPVILVANKCDLVRCKQVSTEGKPTDARCPFRSIFLPEVFGCDITASIF